MVIFKNIRFTNHVNFIYRNNIKVGKKLVDVVMSLYLKLRCWFGQKVKAWAEPISCGWGMSKAG